MTCLSMLESGDTGLTVANPGSHDRVATIRLELRREKQAGAGAKTGGTWKLPVGGHASASLLLAVPFDRPLQAAPIALPEFARCFDEAKWAPAKIVQ